MTAGFNARGFNEFEFNGPVALRLDLSDSVTVSDAQVLGPELGLADSATASEARALDVSAVRSDSASVSDSPARDVATEQTDTASVSDALVTADGVVLGDSVTVTDDHTATLGGQLGLSDSVTVTDQVTTDLTSGIVPPSQVPFPPPSLPRSHRLVLKDLVFAYDDVTQDHQRALAFERSLADTATLTDEIDLVHIEGIPTRQQRRELALLV